MPIRLLRSHSSIVDTRANFALVYSYFVPLEAIHGMQARAQHVVLVVPSPVALDGSATMIVESVARDVEIVAYPSALAVGRRVDRPKSV